MIPPQSPTLPALRFRIRLYLQYLNHHPAGIAELRGLMSRLEFKIDEFTVLEDKLEDHPDLHQTPDPSLLSIPDTVHQLSTRLTHCELNHEIPVTKFYIYKKDVHNFFGMGTPPYINSSNLSSSS